jgi:predicted transcriptional regulator
MDETNEQLLKKPRAPRNIQTPPGSSLARHTARERETQAWIMRVSQGYSEQRIAEELGVSQKTVSMMLQRVEKGLVAETREIVLRVKQEQTAILNKIAEKALEEFERSKQKRVKTFIKKTDGQTKPGEISQETTVGFGDVNYLNAAMEALAEVRKIWGVDEQGEDGKGGLPSVANIQINMPGSNVLNTPVNGPRKAQEEKIVEGVVKDTPRPKKGQKQLSGGEYD